MRLAQMLRSAQPWLHAEVVAMSWEARISPRTRASAGCPVAQLANCIGMAATTCVGTAGAELLIFAMDQAVLKTQASCKRASISGLRQQQRRGPVGVVEFAPQPDPDDQAMVLSPGQSVRQTAARSQRRGANMDGFGLAETWGDAAPPPNAPPPKGDGWPPPNGWAPPKANPDPKAADDADAPASPPKPPPPPPPNAGAGCCANAANPPPPAGDGTAVAAPLPNAAPNTGAVAAPDDAGAPKVAPNADAGCATLPKPNPVVGAADGGGVRAPPSGVTCPNCPPTPCMPAPSCAGCPNAGCPNALAGWLACMAGGWVPKMDAELAGGAPNRGACCAGWVLKSDGWEGCAAGGVEANTGGAPNAECAAPEGAGAPKAVAAAAGGCDATAPNELPNARAGAAGVEAAGKAGAAANAEKPPDAGVGAGCAARAAKPPPVAAALDAGTPNVGSANGWLAEMAVEAEGGPRVLAAGAPTGGVLLSFVNVRDPRLWPPEPSTTLARVGPAAGDVAAALLFDDTSRDELKRLDMDVPVSAAAAAAVAGGLAVATVLAGKGNGFAVVGASGMAGGGGVGATAAAAVEVEAAEALPCPPREGKSDDAAGAEAADAAAGVMVAVEGKRVVKLEAAGAAAAEEEAAGAREGNWELDALDAAGASAVLAGGGWDEFAEEKMVTLGANTGGLAAGAFVSRVGAAEGLVAALEGTAAPVAGTERAAPACMAPCHMSPGLELGPLQRGWSTERRTRHGTRRRASRRVECIVMARAVGSSHGLTVCVDLIKQLDVSCSGRSRLVR